MIYGASKLFKECSEKDKLTMVLPNRNHGPKVLSDVGANSLFLNHLSIQRHQRILWNGRQTSRDNVAAPRGRWQVVSSRANGVVHKGMARTRSLEPTTSCGWPTSHGDHGSPVAPVLL